MSYFVAISTETRWANVVRQIIISRYYRETWKVGFDILHNFACFQCIWVTQWTFVLRRINFIVIFSKIFSGMEKTTYSLKDFTFIMLAKPFCTSLYIITIGMRVHTVVQIILFAAVCGSEEFWWTIGIVGGLVLQVLLICKLCTSGLILMIR